MPETETTLCAGRIPTVGARQDLRHVDGTHCYHIPGDCGCATTMSPHTPSSHSGPNEPWQRGADGRFYPLAFLIFGHEREPIR